MEHLKFCFKSGIVLISLLLIYTTSMVLVQLIPKNYIKGNVIKSCELIEKEGFRKEILPSFLSLYTTLDTYSDLLFIDMAISSNSENPAESAMLNRFYSPENSDAPSAALAIEGANDRIELNEYGWYGRCWNGHQIFVRPLLVLLDYYHMRFLNGLIFIFVTLSLIYLLYSKVDKIFACFTAFFLLYFNYYLVPLCLQFSIVFYIVAFATILLLVKPLLFDKQQIVYLYFLALGSIVCFFDVFTTAYLTLGFPLLILCVKKQQYIRWDKIIFICAIWLIGYSITWGGKFLIGYELTGINILSSAIKAAKIRTSASINGSSISIYGMAYALRILVVPFLMLIVCLPKYLKLMDKNKIKKYSPLFMIFAITPVWFLAMRQHSFLHIFFTYRGWILPVLTVTIFILLTKKGTNIYKLNEQ